jgi:hypothetical protein
LVLYNDILYKIKIIVGVHIIVLYGGGGATKATFCRVTLFYIVK